MQAPASDMEAGASLRLKEGGTNKLSIFDRLFKRDKLIISKFVELYTRGYPLPTAGRTLYEIPEIRTAINFIAEKVASVPLRHVRMVGEGEMLPLDDQVQRLLAVRPNPYNSPQSFVNVVVSRLLVNGNAYVYPEWDGGKLKALWPLPFSSHKYEKDQAGVMRMTFQGANGRYGFLLEDIIHLCRYPVMHDSTLLADPVTNYVNILSTMQAQAVEDAETADRVRALLEAQTPLKLADMKKSLDEFKSLYMTAENTTGMGAIPYGYKVIPLDMKKLPLNVELLNSVTRQLYNYYGISFEIINGNATELQYEQFVDNTVKPICYQVEEEFTYKLFTDREISAGHRIQAQAIDLMIAPLSAQTTFLKEMLFAGVITRNEARILHGLPKGPEELDQFMESKNFSTIGQEQQPKAIQEGGGDAGTGKNDEPTEGQAGTIPEAGA